MSLHIVDLKKASELWAQNVSASQIAALFGVSRSSIIGFTYRNREMFPKKPKKVSLRRIQAEARALMPKAPKTQIAGLSSADQGRAREGCGMSDLGKASVNLMDTLVLERETNGQSPEYSEWGAMMIRRALIAERARCISIAQSIEPHNEAEAHLIETIVRKMRGDE